MEELNFNQSESSLSDTEIKLALTAEEAIRYKVPAGNLKILGTYDGKLYTPTRWIVLQDSGKSVVRFMVEYENGDEYYIRKDMKDYIFSTLSEKQIHLTYALICLENIYDNVELSFFDKESLTNLHEVFGRLLDKVRNTDG